MRSFVCDHSSIVIPARRGVVDTREGTRDAMDLRRGSKTRLVESNTSINTVLKFLKDITDGCLNG